MTAYNPNALPNDEMTPVHMSLGIYGLLEVDTLESVVTLRVALRQRWIDKRLAWKESEFDNIKKTRYSTNPELSDKIWLPDTTLY